MSKRKVEWFQGPANLDEIYQSVAMKFAFVNEINGKLTQCHPWIKCRDFLHDALRTMLTDEETNIYNFTYKKDVNPWIDMNNTRMLISEKDLKEPLKFRFKLSRSLKLLHFYETLAGVELTKIQKVEGDIKKRYEHVWMLTSPKMWMSSPYLISMYTLLIRLGVKKLSTFTNEKELLTAFDNVIKENKGKKDNDVGYLKDVKDYLLKLVLDREKISKYNENGFSYTYFQKTYSKFRFHDRSGIVTTCKCNTEFKDVNTYIKKEFKVA